MVVVLMGVSGAGKTEAGELFAKRVGWRFIDADDLHPPENIHKMKSGVPLTDEDRVPWLLRVRGVIASYASSRDSAVVACSALKKRSRERLLDGLADVRLVYLRASRTELERRLQNRRGHFFHPALLDSQLETLEEPEDALVIDADGALETVVDSIVAALGLPSS